MDTSADEPISLISKHKKDGRNFLKIVRRLLFASLLISAITSWSLWKSDNQHKSVGNPSMAQHELAYDHKISRLPQAIIVGCRKSGTRALLKFLEVNPAVRAAKREVHFFDRPNNYRLGLGWYRAQMPATSAGELTIEKSPAYFVTRNVAERVKSMNSSIKLVFIFRNPVIRLISDYSQLVANRLELGRAQLDSELIERDQRAHEKISNSSRSLEMYWTRAEKEFEKYVLRPDGGIRDYRQAVRAGMYTLHLDRWRSLFDPSQMHFVDGEKLIKDPASELEKLEHFLRLKPFIKREHFVFNLEKGFFCLNSTPVEQQVSGEARQKATPVCLNKSKGRRHVRLRQDLLKKLNDFYQPYNEYLYSLTGIDLNYNVLTGGSMNL